MFEINCATLVVTQIKYHCNKASSTYGVVREVERLEGCGGKDLIQPLQAFRRQQVVR